MIIPQYIPDIIRDLVKRVSDRNVAEGRESVKFDVGHYVEVTKNLVLKDQAIKPESRDKYPIIWLVGDYDEYMNNFPNKYARTSLHLIIGTNTTAQYDMNDRRDKSFLPILYPIYALLLDEIQREPKFGRPKTRRLTHRKTNRPYWGRQDSFSNGKANLWNDFIDAIEIRDLNIQLNNLC